MQKSDEEIKKFIDSKDVISKIELSKFIYGYKSNTSPRVNKWWYYVLQTKNLEKLYNESQKRIKHLGCGHKSYRKDKKKILELLEEDIRLKNSGTRNQVKYLQQFYGIKISRKTLINWRKNETVD